MPNFSGARLSYGTKNALTLKRVQECDNHEPDVDDYHEQDDSGGRYSGFLIEWIFYWIESGQIKIFESIFELNFLWKKIIEKFSELNIP